MLICEWFYEAEAGLVDRQISPDANEKDTNPPWPEIVDSVTYSDYQSFDDMSFQLTDRRFLMRLSAYVPDLLASDVKAMVDELLKKWILTRNDIHHWGVHPGSLIILDLVESRLESEQGALDVSREVLQHSATIPRPRSYSSWIGFKTSRRFISETGGCYWLLSRD